MKSRILFILLIILLLNSCSKRVYDDGHLNVYFCPEEDCETEMAYLILSANESIDCALYSLSSEKVINAFKKSNAKKRFVFNSIPPGIRRKSIRSIRD